MLLPLYPPDFCPRSSYLPLRHFASSSFRYWKKERERAAERLVGNCKMHLARRRMRERRDEVLSRAGALLLQAVFRGHVGRSTFAKVLKKEQRKEMQRAALKIQCVVRCWRAREGLKRQKMVCSSPLLSSPPPLLSSSSYNTSTTTYFDVIL